MKKIGLVVLTFAFTIFSFALSTVVKADSLWYDKSRSWELYNYYSTYYGIRLTDNTVPYISTQESVTAGSIEFPLVSDSISTIGATDSSLSFYNADEEQIYKETVNNLYGWTSNFSGIVSFVQQELITETGTEYEIRIINGVTDDVVDSFRSVDPIAFVGFNVMLNTSSPSSSLLNYWQDYSRITLYTASLRIDCYSYMKRVSTIYMTGSAPIAPPDPTPKTGYIFVGWNTITGERFDFSTGYYDPEWVTDNDDGSQVIKLFAIYRSEDTNGTDFIPEVQEKPTWLTDLFDLIHFNSSIGYAFVFVAVAVLIALAMLSNKLTGRVEMIVAVELLWIIIATWLGMIPIYFTAILTVMAITLLLNTLNGQGAV